MREAAARFGGGGHRLAAGFTADGELPDVLDRLRDALRVPQPPASG
ncbi:MAG TPA: DHH family phosphoesterase [Actinophytocola sp.]|nr:DHH family phosphoesterase [Actinophytocola sp.]